MTHGEILTKAITKAIAGGFNYLGKPENGWGVDVGQWVCSNTHLTIVHNNYDQLIHYAEIIFNHDFAKALWGSETLSPNYGDMEMLSAAKAALYSSGRGERQERKRS